MTPSAASSPGSGPEWLSWHDGALSQGRAARRAGEVIHLGGLVVYPTDTVYGLGADPTNPDATRRVYEVKGRPDEKAIVWLVASVDDCRPVCRVGSAAEVLAERFWPGPLTLVLPRRSTERSARSSPHSALSPQHPPTLAFRIPAHPAALAIIRAAGGAVATTSANRSGQPSTRTAGDAAAQIGEGVDLIIDAGPTPGGTESTVLDLTVSPVRVLRPGPITLEQIVAVLGTVGSHH
jgi:L-threonylcarbamoyladenylate synthase